MSRIEQVSTEELVNRETVRRGDDKVRVSKIKNSKLFEYIIPLFKRGVRLWR